MARKTEVAEATIGKGEARKLVDEAKLGFEKLILALIAIKHRCAWIILGYKSEAECIDQEFGRTMQWANEQIRIAETARRVLCPPSGYSGPKHEQQLSIAKGGADVRMMPVPQLGVAVVRELQKVPEEDQKSVFDTAVKLAEQQDREKPTVADVGRAADMYRGELPESGGEPEEAAAEPLCDSEGNEVPEAAQALFADHPAYKEIMAGYRVLQKKWEALQGRRSAQAMNISCHKTLIGFSLSAMRQGLFDVPCPECKGKGCDYCLGWGGLLPNRSVKDGDKAASEAQIKYVYEAFEKKGRRYPLTGHEAKRRLDLYVAQYNLKKPTGCRPQECPFRKAKEK